MTQTELTQKALNLKKGDAEQHLPLSDPFYRPRMIAERTGRNYAAITAAIRAGEMKAVKLGKRAIGVRASEVQRWLDSLNGGASSEEAA